MSLTFTGVTVPLPDGGISFQAKNAEGQMVAVKATEESLEDHGESAVMRRAIEKYEAGDFIEGGNVRVITVRTTDFEN